MSQRNLDAVRAVYERWGKGDFTASLEIMDPEVEFVMPPELPDSGTYRGFERLAEYMGHFLEPWTQIAIEAEAIAGAGDRVVAAVRQHGVGSGSGIETEIRYFQTWTFRDSKVIRLENSRERPADLDERRG